MQQGTYGMTWRPDGWSVSLGGYRVHKPLPGAGTSTVMAELVRQVTSSCAERGRALAATWNVHVGLTDALAGALAMAQVSLPGPYMLLPSGEAWLIRVQAAQPHRPMTECHGL